MFQTPKPNLTGKEKLCNKIISRIGQYSYIGDDGKTYTVKYSAGVDGFRILGGDHIPSGGQKAAAAQLVVSILAY